ncbi:chemotaxis-specific protein-glutamate methyltransferase CheB [Salinarimonas soli]|uniref:Protein-glutamate methylesterase/protein-glutamine glutaminase n=1 Tax=Salinarimonas soli TaxID=1638099 RepID=A0A5B2VBZ5_9HYPH|nr:chemotaxis-specific protein-glutamate methyltransferase CheB [Salinarimonas soli]KAA2236278.1 chemotaxis-specific protein-glutamate methyltransferase CheB [Salinarimonas soli]
MIKVLVVDDSALLRKLLGGIFAAEPDIETAFARNGLEALEQLHAFHPDVITLDVHMPGLDGLACLDRIMVERPCPVVMVSSLTAEGAEATLEALRLGAVDFVAKPTGAVSLRIDALAPTLVKKVRAAAGARLRPSLRLRDRIRHRTGRPEARAEGSRPAIPGAGLVLVGTSTGGPPALEALLAPIPKRFPWPILIAQHMPATFTGPLARRLDGLTALDVVEVARPTLLEPGFAYVGRGDADIVVSRRPAGLVAVAVPSQAGYPWHPSADRLVRSAMEHVPPSRLVGILMTGMGYDGAPAMAEMRAQGGRTIAESAETAVVWGMPGELARLDGADHVLPLPAIPERLLAWVV